ncbi:MAG: response regulator transcription factor [Planctomycetes bacterium]|nr:response regulator transcription factor [Planctomycetota bacterium]MBI3834133.1 response regulator transcription factor [Planctomycetota bacterium]
MRTSEVRATEQVHRVLLVEDDRDVARTVSHGLETLGFEVTFAANIAVAAPLVATEKLDAVILDRMLPDGDGLDFVARLRAGESDVPILMLTARDTIPDRLAGFDRGADDYLGKPFDINELAARLRAMIRRAHRLDRHLLQYGDLELDLVTRKARRPGLEATLSDGEAELLAFLMRHPGDVLSRETLLDELWGDEMDESSNIVNVYINLLRNKIESKGHTRLIRTIRGVGYTLTEKDTDEIG